MKDKMDMQLIRVRHLKDRTLGVLIADGFGFATLELPWRDNMMFLSCIPVGRYKCRIKNSPKFGECIEVLDVEGRTDILIHHGNWPKNTVGCILIGEKFSDLDNDKLPEVSNSKKALTAIVAMCKQNPENLVLEIS
ncbi:MAG: DUF5675 family protein [Pusillimonas sp.]